MANVEELITRVITVAETRGFEDQIRQLLGAAKANEELARTGEKLDKSLERPEKRYNSLVASVDKAAKVSQQYQKDLDRLAASTQTLGLSTEEVAKRLEQIQQKYYGAAMAAQALEKAQREAAKSAVLMTGLPATSTDRQWRPQRAPNFGALGAYSAMTAAPDAAAMQRARNEAKLTAAEIFQLGQQVQDFGVQVSSGQGFLIPLVQQGSQVTAVLGGTSRAMAVLRSALSPVVLGFGASAAAATTAAVAYSNYLSSTKAVETALGGLGRSVGMTASSLEAMTASYASAAGLSVSATRGMEVQLIRTGRISGEAFGPLIEMTRDFAATIGTSTEEASKALTDFVAKPAQGARALYEQYGLLDGAEVRHIEQLMRQNREQDAQNALIAALPAKLSSAEQATTALGRAWQSVGIAVSNSMDNIGWFVDKAISGFSTEEVLKNLQADLKVTESLNNNNFHIYDKQVEALRKQIDILQGIVDLEKERVQLEAKATADRRAGETAYALAQKSPANATAMAQQGLSESVIAMTRGLRSDQLSSTDRDQIAAAIDAASRALNTYIPAAERAAQIDAVDRQIAEARDPLRKAELAARRQALQLAGQEITTGQAQIQIENARTKALLDSASAATVRAQQSTLDATRQAEMAGMTSYERMMAMINNRYQDQILLAAGNAEAIRKVTEARNAEINAAQRDATLGPITSAVDNINGQIALLRVQRDTFGETAGRIAEAVERQRLLNEYTRQGVPITQDLAKAIDSAAQRQGQLVEATKDLADRQSKVVEMMDAVRDLSNDSLGGLFKDLSRGKNPMESLINAGYKFGDKLIDSGVKDITESLFGKGGTAEGAPSWLKELFGVKDAAIPDALSRQMMTGSMTVQAASVTVNGLGGLPGLCGGAPGTIAGRQPAGMPPIPGLMPTNAGAVPAGTSFGGITPSADTLAMLNQTAQRYGINPADFATTARIESAFRPGATNGSMKGMFQFSPDTARDYGLTNPFDPAMSADAAARLWLDNKQSLTGMLGREPMGWELYAAHQQGIGGMGALLQNPNMPAADALNTLPFYANRPGLANLAITGNGGNLNMNSTQFLDVWKGKFEAMVPAVSQMTPALNAMQDATMGAGGALGQLPSILSNIGGGGGGGLFGSLFGSLFGGTGSPAGSIGGLYAEGGIASRPSIFGEAGPEAAVPLSRGRFIPVDVRMRSGGGGGNRNTSFRGGDVYITVPGGGQINEDTKNELRKEFGAALRSQQRETMEFFQNDRENSWRYAG